MANEHCVHHWVLGLPQKDVVRGRCKRCGAVREYPATVDGLSRQGIFEETGAINRPSSAAFTGSGRRGVA